MSQAGWPSPVAAFTANSGGEVANVTGRRRWWDGARTPRQGLRGGICFALIGFFEVVGGLAAGRDIWLIIAGVCLLPVSAMYFASFVAQRRQAKTQPNDVRS